MKCSVGSWSIHVAGGLACLSCANHDKSTLVFANLSVQTHVVETVPQCLHQHLVLSSLVAPPVSPKDSDSSNFIVYFFSMESFFAL